MNVLKGNNMKDLIVSLGMISSLLLGGILSSQPAKSEEFPGDLLIEESDFGPADFGEIEENAKLISRCMVQATTQKMQGKV